MQKGFYTIASGMITQSRRLDVVSNNIANVSTPGYKRDTLITTTFGEELQTRVGNRSHKIQAEIGNSHGIAIPHETVYDFSEGAIVESERTLDVAIHGNGMFAVQTPGGNTYYTRGGSFSLDENGYLSLSGVGRVLGTGGAIYLGTDEINITPGGQIYGFGGNFIGALQITDFNDYTQLIKTAQGGVFEAPAGAGAAPAAGASVRQYALERSNADYATELTVMMSAQRNLQSGAQLLKIYDQIMGRAVNDIAKI